MNFWHGLIRVAGGGVMADWQAAFGEWTGFASGYALRCGELADSIPCPSLPSCGCRHEILPLGDNLMAVCRCVPEEFGRCEPGVVTSEAAGLIEVDLARLGQDIASALRLAGVARETLTGPLIATAFLELGKLPSHRAPVVLYVPSARRNQWAELQQLSQLQTGPLLLLTPFRGRWHQEIERWLWARESACLALADCLTPAKTGGFQPTGPIDSVLLEWEHRVWPPRKSREALCLLRREIADAVRRKDDPKVCSDTTAAQVFALIQELELRTNWKKAPVLQVFILYCLDALSASQIAGRCGCSKTLVVRRLKYLRQKLRRDPIELRSIASHFEAMLESLNDPRARHIRRRSAMEAEGEDDDDR
jgi:hypothetical protein